MNKLQKGSCGAVPPERSRVSYFKSIKFWKTPVAACGWKPGDGCMDYNAWQQAWTRITG